MTDVRTAYQRVEAIGGAHPDFAFVSISADQSGLNVHLLPGASDQDKQRYVEAADGVDVVFHPARLSAAQCAQLSAALREQTPALDAAGFFISSFGRASSGGNFVVRYRPGASAVPNQVRELVDAIAPGAVDFEEGETVALASFTSGPPRT